MGVHRIEAAKTGRSSCRQCKQKIAKAELRLGVGHAQEHGGHSMQWYHLQCATQERFLELEEALAENTLAVPNQTALEAGIAASIQGQPAATYPRAIFGSDCDTYHCVHCGNWSFPSTIRIVVIRPVTVGGRTFDRPVPIDVGCANEYLGDPALLDTVIQNTGPIDDFNLKWLKESMT